MLVEVVIENGGSLVKQTSVGILGLAFCKGVSLYSLLDNMGMTMIIVRIK